jgi:hypothetical protein
VQSKYGIASWRCGPERTLPGVEVCGASDRGLSKEALRQWQIHREDFQVLVSQFEGNRLLGVSYVFAAPEGSRVMASLPRRLSAIYGTSSGRKNVAGWEAESWSLNAEVQVVLTLQPAGTAELSFAPKSVFVRRFGNRNAEEIFKKVVSCKPHGIDVCDVAKRLVAASAPSLPFQMNKNMQLSHMFSDGPVVVAVALLAYTREELAAQSKRAGVTEQQLLATMTNTATEGMCKPGTIGHRFVSDGGQIRYDYKGADGRLVAQINVTSC